MSLSVQPGLGYVPGGGETSVEIEDDDVSTGRILWLTGATSTGGFRDDSGAARHAVAQPAARGPGSVAVPGGGSGFSFNGIDQTLQLPRFTLDSSGAFTLAFRFRLTPGAVVANQNLISFGARGSAGSLQVYLSSATSLRTNLKDSTGGLADAELDVTGTWTDGTWRHYALVVDALGGRRVYIEGTLVRSAPGWRGSLSSMEQLWLGWRAQNASTGHLSGALADVGVFRRVVTSAEISALASGRPTFAAWREERGLPTTSTASDDPDADAQPNAVEYALGTDPTRAASVPVLTLAREGGVATLAFIHHAPTADVTLALEASDTGGPWQPLGALAAGATTWTSLPGISISDAGGAVLATDTTRTSARTWRLRIEVTGITPPFIAFFNGPSPEPASMVSRITNLSILTDITAIDPLFTVGAVIGGAGTSGNKALLIRAAGPALAALGVGSPLADPKLEVFSGQTVTASNDNWGGAAALNAAFTQVGAFAYSSAASKDAAVFNPALPTGGYTVQVSGVGGATGTVIAELYDSTPESAFTAATPRLINVSVLKQVGAGEILTAGFVIGGAGAKQVLIRAVGPTLGLTPFNIPGVMADPKLELFSGQTVINSSNDWGGGTALAAAFASVGAFALPPASKDAALLVSLAPGNYTAQVTASTISGQVGGTGGVVLVEVYEVP
ncbi:MAG: LamG domain-containing protein [Opitutus sp.]|nr:LamG domain-containing protein [Opitutus sp.]